MLYLKTPDQHPREKAVASHPVIGKTIRYKIAGITFQAVLFLVKCPQIGSSNLLGLSRKRNEEKNE